MQSVLMRGFIMSVLTVVVLSESGLAAGGTMIVASKGQKAPVAASLPKGAGDLINDPARTTGWNSWFSEWPNDVNQYGYDIESMGDINRLITKLAAVKAPLRRVHLSFMTEPRTLGWVTSLPEGNDMPVIFSIGDQSRIDQWYGRVRKPFGKMEFVDTPVAVPPTLTIFVRNKKIELDRLVIPKGVEVQMGHVPTVFLHSNTTIEKERETAAAKKDQKTLREEMRAKLDPGSRETFDRINRYLQERQGRSTEQDSQ